MGKDSPDDVRDFDESSKKMRPHGRTSTLADGGLAARKELWDRFCAVPFRNVDVDLNGDVGVCCMNWLPKTIGNILAQAPETLWNSPAAREVRRSILDGSFRHCVQEECPWIQQDALPRRSEVTDPDLKHAIITNDTFCGWPTRISLNYDESCNLSCPSCRAAPVLHGSGPEYEQRARIQQRVIDAILTEPHDRSIEIHITGSGDPFGSRLFWSLLQSIDGRMFPNVRISLQTNGVLCTPDNWSRMSGIHANIARISVSVDAATSPTYAQVRRGGNWERLQENLAFLAAQRARGEIDWLQLDFVVQRANYTEMPQFVALARALGHVDRVCFSLITDWGSYDDGQFAEQAIWRQDHPEFPAFVEILREAVFDDPLVALGNLAAYRRRA